MPIRRAAAAATPVLKAVTEPTFQRVSAERALLAELKAGCQTPIAINTSVDNDQLHHWVSGLFGYPTDPEGAVRTTKKFNEYMIGLLDERRRAPFTG